MKAIRKWRSGDVNNNLSYAFACPVLCDCAFYYVSPRPAIRLKLKVHTSDFSISALFPFGRIIVFALHFTNSQDARRSGSQAGDRLCGQDSCEAGQEWGRHRGRQARDEPIRGERRRGGYQAEGEDTNSPPEAYNLTFQDKVLQNLLL